MLLLLLVLVLALLGAPVFVIMAGSTIIAWLTHETPSLQHTRFLAPDVLDERFAGSPILVTVPLFTFVGYMMAQSRAPERIVRAANESPEMIMSTVPSVRPWLMSDSLPRLDAGKTST